MKLRIETERGRECMKKKVRKYWNREREPEWKWLSHSHLVKSLVIRNELFRSKEREKEREKQKERERERKWQMRISQGNRSLPHTSEKGIIWIKRNLRVQTKEAAPSTNIHIEFAISVKEIWWNFSGSEMNNLNRDNTCACVMWERGRERFYPFFKHSTKSAFFGSENGRKGPWENRMRKNSRNSERSLSKARPFPTWKPFKYTVIVTVG